MAQVIAENELITEKYWEDLQEIGLRDLRGQGKIEDKTFRISQPCLVDHTWIDHAPQLVHQP